MLIKNISIADIKIGKRLWDINELRIIPLAESIEKVGLMNPITVLESEGEYILIAGEHRINAFKHLGRETIPCHVYHREFEDIERDKAKCIIMECDENLMRKVRDSVEEGFMMYHRKEAYEIAFPEATKEAKQREGAKSGLAVMNNTSSEKFSELDNTKTFTQDTAEKLGITERMVQQKTRRGEMLSQTSETTQNKALHLQLTGETLDNIVTGTDEQVPEAVDIHLETLETMDEESRNKKFNKAFKELKKSKDKDYQKNNPVEFAKELKEYITKPEEENESLDIVEEEFEEQVRGNIKIPYTCKNELDEIIALLRKEYITFELEEK